MNFVAVDVSNVHYEQYPFPHTIIDNFLKTETLPDILTNVNNLTDAEASRYNSIFLASFAKSGLLP